MLGAEIAGIISVPTSSLAILTPNMKHPIDFTKDLKIKFIKLNFKLYRECLKFIYHLNSS